MTRNLIRMVLLVAMLAVVPTPTRADIALPPPGPMRMVNADATFVGRVAKFEPIDMETTNYPGAKQKVQFRVAEVVVQEWILGVKNTKTVRVAFVVPMPPKPGVPITGRGYRSPQLTIGQEGLFTVDLHHEGKFYRAPNFGYFVPRQQKNFDEDVQNARLVIRVLANPIPALEAKNADERLQAAAILVAKYRSNRAGRNAAQELIDAKESKLILSTIASAAWQPTKFGQVGPWQLFIQLGIGKEDGWNPQNLRSFDDQRKAVQAWIAQHGDTYRIKRFTAAAGQ